MNRLSCQAMGLAAGVLWSGGVIFMGVIGMMGSWSHPFVHALGQLYLGYTPTLVGSIIGGLWGFVDGFFGGFLLAYLYNKFLPKN